MIIADLKVGDRVEFKRDGYIGAMQGVIVGFRDASSAKHGTRWFVKIRPDGGRLRQILPSRVLRVLAPIPTTV